MKKIRLLLIEDNRLLREGMTSMVKNRRDLRIVAASENLEDVLPRAKELEPDVVLLGLNSHDHNSSRDVEIVKKKIPQSKLILMGVTPTRRHIFRLVKSGLSGLLLKDATFDEFLKTVRSVAEGTMVIPPQLISSLFSQVGRDATRDRNVQFSDPRMTRREREVIELIREGLSNKEIAQTLHIATYTVKSHVHNILTKLALRSRGQITAYAHRQGTFKNQIQ